MYTTKKNTYIDGTVHSVASLFFFLARSWGRFGRGIIYDDGSLCVYQPHICHRHLQHPGGMRVQRRAAAAAVRYMATFPERMRVKEYSRSLCVIITCVVEECRPSTHKNSNQLGITAFF